MMGEAIASMQAARHYAQREAMAQQRLGGLQGLAQGLVGSPRDIRYQEVTYRGQPVKKNFTFKEELQDEIDQWLEDI